MWKLLVLAVALNIIVYSSCQEVSDTNCCNSGEDDEMNDCFGALPRARKSIFQFTFQFVYELLTSSTNDIIVASPVQAWYLLAQLGLYSFSNESDVQPEVFEFLGLENNDEIRCVLKLLDSFTKDPPNGVVFEYTSNIVADIKNQFTKSFKEDMVEYVEGRTRNYNFSNPNKSTRMLNKDVARDTNNRLRNIIQSSDIFNCIENLAFVTGVYFRSKWQIAYNANNITMQDFYDKPNEVIQVPYVYQEAIYNYTYSSKLQAQVVEIPFKDRFFTCLLILPTTRCGLKSMVQKLAQDPDIYDETYNSLKPAFVKLTLPVFDNTTLDIETVPILKQNSELTYLFDAETSQLENVYEKNKTAFISYGHQKVRTENVLTGAEPYYAANECPEKTNKLEQVDFLANTRLLYLILNNGGDGVPTIGAISKVIRNT